MTTHSKAELVLLGVLEDSLGDRHRSTNGVTPDEATSRANLAEMIDLERTIDLRVQARRVTDSATVGRHRSRRSAQ